MFKKWALEFFVMSIYKTIFDFLFLPKYMSVFSYLFGGAEIVFNYEKYLISCVVYCLFGIIMINNKPCRNYIYNSIIRFIYYICVIPMLSVYSFFSYIDFMMIVYPLIFFFILTLCIKHYGAKRQNTEKVLFSMPPIKYVDTAIVFVSGMLAIVIWAMAGFPTVFSFDIAYEQRMQLRAAALPAVINYAYLLIGSTVFPYLFAKNMNQKKYFYATVCLFLGLILFFVNGMKTWLLLYPLYFGFTLIARISKENEEKNGFFIGVMLVLLLIISIVLFDKFQIVDLISQYARVTIVPAEIGFKSIAFFQKNELLYLRESILRGLFSTPYVGGSDFYLYYGANSTLTSSRANNGLWGDAYRNFGFIGIVIYPFLIAKIYSIVETNSRDSNYAFRLFVLFMIFWSSINTSFFTWLITGGVFLVVILEKIDKANTLNKIKDKEKIKGKDYE